MTVHTGDIADLVARIRTDIAALGARDPQHESMIEELVFSLLGREICGEKAGPFILAAIDARRPAKRPARGESGVV